MTATTTRFHPMKSPFLPERFSTTWDAAPVWPAWWIYPEDQSSPDFVEFALDFDLDRDETLHLHLTASERYRLHVDGELSGEGPERGDFENWFFDSYRLDLDKGRHSLRIEVRSLEQAAPEALLGARTGLIAAVQETSRQAILNTGQGDWRCRRMGGWSLLNNPWTPFTGDRFRFDAAAHRSSRNEPAVECLRGSPGREKRGFHNAPLESPLLRPATLPAMMRQSWPHFSVRHACQALPQPPAPGTPEALLIEEEAHLPEIAADWNGLLNGRQPVSIPARRSISLLLDAGDYLCAYPHLEFSGNATLSIRSAESLFEFPPYPSGGHPHPPKGNRDVIFGKWFSGPGDRIVGDGGSCRFDSPLWQAGRYWLVSVETQESSATITRCEWIETRLPLEPRCRFEGGEAGFAGAWPILVRGLQTCQHDLVFDCPYYEQLCYLGDARLQILSSWCLGAGDAMAVKTLELFAEAQLGDGLLPSRYPSRTRQIIAPFSLVWIGLLRDFAMWRDDPATVRRLAPTGRRILSAFEAHLDADGLLGPMPGWNFIDWVVAPGWRNGVPPGGLDGSSASLHWAFVCGLRWMSEIERALNEPEMEAHWLRKRTEAAKAAEVFFDPGQNLYSDDLGRSHFSEHTQALAILSGVLERSREMLLATALESAGEMLAPASIYFGHYVLEALAATNRYAGFFHRLREWNGLAAAGLKTPRESPEPSRSDCHGWGSHPIYHAFASILGIRPASPGFRSVQINPMPLPEGWGPIRATLPHTRGVIEVEVDSRGRLVDRRVPEGVKIVTGP